MSLTPSNRNNPCPICEDTAGKCRQGTEDQDYWQCMIYSDARKGEIVGGFKCIGHTRDRLWGQFRIDTSQEWSEQQWLERKRENQWRRQEKAKADDERRRRSLSPQERHEQYTRLLGVLTLHPDDRADLRRRGFTDDQIELCGFKSIGRYQPLEGQFSELLPGVNRRNRLIIPDEGYLCPLRDINGLIVACQVRLRILRTSESGRYRWLSGDGQVLHLFPEGCKPEGELPLSVYYPQQRQKCGVGLCEGTGAKPFLASQRLGIPFIGAAGGLFTSSQRLLEIYLERLCDHEQEVIIPVDAGDILNNQVLARWRRVVALIEKMGYSVRIAWWGQTDKNHPDIDELENLDSIQYLTPAEFTETAHAARKHLGLEARINFNLSSDDSENTSEAKSEKQTPNKGFSNDEPEWKIKARAAWRKKRQFHADIKEATEWCNFSRPGANTIAFYKAGLGRGKTTKLRAWVKEWKQLEDISFLCLGYRNTLLLQLCGDDEDKEGKKAKGLGFYHLHEHSGLAMKSAPGEGIALCVDSLWRFCPEDFDEKIIILDEAKSIIKHLLHSSTVKNRDKILNLFGEAIRRSRQVICLDGLMTDWVVDYLHALAPEKQIIRAENTYLGEKPRVNFLLGTTGIDNKIRVNDRTPWLKYLLEDSPMPAVCSDSQVMIEALDELLSAKGLKVLRVDSKTVPEQYVKDFLLNCDAYIKQHRPDVLLYTPSAESGVDVSIPNHFTHHFAFFFGVLDVDGILQMTGRIRDNITKFVWCKAFATDNERQHSNSPFTETIANSINEILMGDITSSIDDNLIDKIGNHIKSVIANSLDANFRTSCIIKSIENFEKSNLRQCLREELVKSGYKVVDCTLDNHEESGKKAKEASEQIKRQNCADIFNAEKVACEWVDDLKFDATWEERCKVIQAKLRERLPGIEDTSIWGEDFIYLTRYDDRNFINNLENYWLFTHPDIAKRQSQENLHWMARRLHTFIGNVKSRWARIHALLQMAFDRFLDPSKEWTNESPELIALITLGKQYSNALGKHPGKSTPVQFLGNLLGLFGLKLKSKKDSEGKRWYRLDEEVLADPIRQQVLACVEAKMTQPKQEIDWDAAINEAHGVQTDNQPQAQTEQASEGTAPSPNFLYTNQLEGAVNNLGSQEVDESLASVPKEETLTLVDEVAEHLPCCQSFEDLKLIALGYSSQVMESAIALQSSPLRSQLEEWFERVSQLKLAAAEELAHPDWAIESSQPADTSERPPLTAYRPGQVVWAFFPQSQRKWLKATVEWVRANTVRVVSGFFGMHVEQPHLIAPLHWSSAP